MTFDTVVWRVYCSWCKVTMPGERWPSHYRTKVHRAAVQEAKGER